MRFWGKGKKSAKSQSANLGFEKLEDRTLLAVIPIVSGHTTSFHDADGTMVRVKLTGPGQGTLELTNGATDRGSIENLTLTGTTGETTLKITAKGGRISGTTIEELVIDNAVNQLGALRQFYAPKVDIAAGGQMTADGNIGDIQLRHLQSGAQIDVAGNVGQMRARTLHVGASVDVSGTLGKFVADVLNSGSEVEANQIGYLQVKQRAVDATFDVGDGGLQYAKFKDLFSSVITSDGDIGEVYVKGNMIGSSLASNIDAGSDGEFATIDDFEIDPSATGNIHSVKLKGGVGAVGTSQEVKIVASGNVGPVELNRRAQSRNALPMVWEQAASQYIPLVITQESLNATGFTDDNIWVAVFGEQIAIPGPGVVPPPAQNYYLEPSALNAGVSVFQSTAPLVPTAGTPNLPILPSYTLTQWGSNLSFLVLPAGYQFTGRIVISAGAPVQAQVNQDSYHSVSAPSAGNPTDPSNGTYYDFLEFTITNNNGTVSLDMDTSQVDSFGMPMGLQFFQDAAGTQPFNFQFTGTTNLTNSITGITNLQQLVLDGLGTGQPITGAGIPAGTLITGYDIDATTITLNQAATNSTSVQLTAYAGGTVGVEAARDDILTGTTNDALFQFLQNQIAAGNTQAQAFLQTAAPFRTAGAMQISGASNTSPVTITTYNTTGLANGDWVSISGVGGNTGANGVYQIGNLTSTSFTLDGSTGNGTYTSGGTWSMAITGASNAGPIVINASNTLGLQNGDLVEITGVEGNTAANGMWFVSNVTSTSFELAGSTGNAAYTSGGTWNVFEPGNRLVSPKDIVEGLATPQDLNVLNNFYNEAIDALFLQYLPTGTNLPSGATPGGQTFSLVSTAYNNSAISYSGQVELDTTYGAYALTLSDSTNTDPTTYKIYYPFFASNTPADYTPQLPIATTTPPWIISQGWSDQSASQMIFACDAVFADNIARATYDMKATGAVTVLGDLEDSVSAAFNRGIVLNTPSTWNQISTWFQQNTSQSTAAGIQPGTYNYWVEYWHQAGLTYNDLAYAFPFDDKFGASTNLDIANVGLAKITLGAWSDAAGISQTTTSFQSFPTSASATGNIALTAQVAGASPTGTVSFFINGIPINSNDSSSTPPVEPVAVNSSGLATITAQMPQLPSGSAAATYTVTAVYSGDANNLPSIAYASLPIVPQIAVTLTTTSGVLGSSTQINSVIPGTNYNGTLTYSISRSDGSGSQTLGSVATTTQNNQQTFATPSNLLTFTGNANGTNMITGVSSTTDLLMGQVVSGAGVPTGTTISNVSGSSVTLNNVVPAGSGITFTSNGDGATLPITVSFTPSGSMTPSASGIAEFTVTADPYSFAITPGSGALGATPTMTVTLPGPPYNGTVEFTISRPDGTDVQSMGTVNVNSGTLSNGNQVVVNTLAIPADVLTFTGYPDGSNVVQGMSTVSGWVPGQTITGTGVPAGTTLSNWAPASLVLTNPADAGASSSPTDPQTLTASNGVAFTGWIAPSTTTFNVISVHGWNNTMNLGGLSITGNDIGAGNTIQTFTPGMFTLNNNVAASATQITFTSSAENSAYPITAIWTPTGGTALTSVPISFAVT